MTQPRRPGFPGRPNLVRLEDRDVPATLSGMVYADMSGNGLQDAGEGGLKAVTVQLDVNADGTIDQTVATGADGSYSFANVPDGTHTVLIVPPAGTTPLGPTTRVVAVAGADATNVNIGLRPDGKVSGAVFNDLNGNGKQDAGEFGLAGVAVHLDVNSDGLAEFATTTATDGSYVFANIPDGTHSVIVSPPVNYKAGGTDPISVTVSKGSAVVADTLPLVPTTGLSGRVYMGQIDPGQSGVPGLTVQLDDYSDGTFDATTTTGPDGSYYFANVPNGTHTVKVVAPPGSDFATPTGNDSIVTSVNGKVQGGIDFAVDLPGAVTGGLFVDANGNGKLDPGEKGLRPGAVRVELAGSGKAIDVTPTMNPDGTFTVTGLPDGTHTLVITPPGSYTTAANTRVTFTVANGGTATITPIGVRQTVGSTVAIGSGVTPGATTYTFAMGKDGKLTPSAGRTVIPQGKTGARVVAADFNGDGTDDIITATGAGEIGIVRVYDGKTGAELTPAGGVQVFEGNFKGGINLAAGDFNGDGKADIVATADTGGGSRVRILNAAQFQVGADPAQGKYLADFLGIEDPNFRGGSRAAVGDVNGDGTPDLIIAAGQGGGPRIAVFDGTSLATGTPTHLVADFFAFEQNLRNGAVVGVGDVNGDGKADLIAGAGPGGAPRVAVFSGVGVMDNKGADSPRIADFFLNGDTGTRNGTRITVKDVDQDGKADLIASTGGKASVFTAKGLSDFYLNPGDQTAPPSQADLAPFSNVDKAGLFLG